MSWQIILLISYLKCKQEQKVSSQVSRVFFLPKCLTCMCCRVLKIKCKLEQDCHVRACMQEREREWTDSNSRMLYGQGMTLYGCWTCSTAPSSEKFPEALLQALGQRLLVKVHDAFIYLLLPLLLSMILSKWLTTVWGRNPNKHIFKSSFLLKIVKKKGFRIVFSLCWKTIREEASLVFLRAMM